MEMSLHGSSRHSTNSQGSSQHGTTRTGSSSHGPSPSGSQHGGQENNGAGADDDADWVWSDILNPLTRSFHGMSDRISSHSSRSSPEGDDDADGDDSDSDDSDDSANGFQVAPADVGHESGTWLRGF